MYDKSTVLTILGSLIKNPALLLDNKYNITEQDFVERFHTIIYGAIKNLYLSGVKTITPIEIDTYLSSYAIQKKIFDDNNGIQYIENLIKFARTENFDFHYNILKKYTLLRKLKAQGIDVSNIIDDNIVDPQKVEQMMSNFNKLTTNDILNGVERRIITVKDEFYNNDEEEEQHIAQGLSNLIAKYKETPEMGLPTNSNILNTICRGIRRRAFYLVSSPSGTFKSRIALSNAGKISVPWFFDLEKQEWVYTGFNVPTLYITTELEVYEVQTMLAAYISGIEETKILDGHYTIEEAQRIEQAIKYIEESNLYIVHLPNYSIADIERVIRKYALIHDVGYVFFDYIFITPKLLSELAKTAKGVAVRGDSALQMLAIRLKDLCNELNIHISSSTQVCDGWQESKHPDSSLIKESKSLAEKTDLAMIGLPPSKEELEFLKPELAKGIYPTPNLCYHIYKVRRGSYNKIKLFLHFNAGTCRTTELFATNNNNEIIEITGTNIEKVLDDTTTEIEQIVSEADLVIKQDVQVDSIESNEDLPFDI